MRRMTSTVELAIIKATKGVTLPPYKYLECEGEPPELVPNTEYTLSLQLLNALAQAMECGLITLHADLPFVGTPEGKCLCEIGGLAHMLMK